MIVTKEIVDKLVDDEINKMPIERFNIGGQHVLYSKAANASYLVVCRACMRLGLGKRGWILKQMSSEKMVHIENEEIIYKLFSPTRLPASANQIVAYNLGLSISQLKSIIEGG